LAHAIQEKYNVDFDDFEMFAPMYKELNKDKNLFPDKQFPFLS